jgi:hypothetical protein
MTKRELKADLLLMDAKDSVRKAIKVLDPNAIEPAALAILRVLDTIDKARKALKGRWQ